jgi:hypothetical protein
MGLRLIRSDIRQLLRLPTLVIAVACIAGAVLWGPGLLQSRSTAGVALPVQRWFPPVQQALVGPIPFGQPMILYRRFSDNTQSIIGASWNGLLYRAPEAAIGPISGSQSPDGSKILMGLVVVDLATGAETRLPIDVMGQYPRLTWGDDSQHLCMTQETGTHGLSATISTVGVGLPLTHLARLGHLTAGREIIGPTVLACSPLTGRIVVAQVGVHGETTEIWVLNAHTGGITYHKTYPPTTNTNRNGYLVVASRDGRFLAETNTATASVAIRRLADDSVEAELAREEVHAFSWRDNLVIVTPRQPNVAANNAGFQSPALVDWHTGQTVWQSPQGVRFFGSFLSEPDGDGIALSLNFCELPPGCLDQLWLINSGSTRADLDYDVQVLWSGS